MGARAQLLRVVGRPLQKAMAQEVGIEVIPVIFKERTGFDDGWDVVPERKRGDENNGQVWGLTRWRGEVAIP